MNAVLYLHCRNTTEIRGYKVLQKRTAYPDSNTLAHRKCKKGYFKFRLRKLSGIV